MLNLPEDYILIRADEDPKDTVRTAYELVCKIDNFSDKESAADMFKRVRKFIFVTLQSELVALELQAYQQQDTAKGAVQAQLANNALKELHEVKRHYLEVYYGWKKVTL